jgi:DNA polymerase-3 subunit gamma/tau
LDSEYKVYILDECHMFSTGAWNAMLKLIEEPPAKTIFIFCTTDPQKIPATILSRVQRYDFQRITYGAILERLCYIAEQEGVEYEKSALEYIAKLAEGGMRDAITMLDKCLSFSKDVLTLKDVVEALGTVDYDTMFEILGFLLARKTVPLLAKIDTIHKSGVDLKQFMKQFGWFVLDVCKYQKLGNFEYLQIPEIYERQMEQLMEFQESNLLEILHKVLEVNNLIRWEVNAKALIEASFILYCEGVGG